MIVQTVLITLAAVAYEAALEARALRDAVADGPPLPAYAPVPADAPPRPVLPTARPVAPLPAGAPVPVIPPATPAQGDG